MKFWVGFRVWGSGCRFLRLGGKDFWEFRDQGFRKPIIVPRRPPSSAMSQTRLQICCKVALVTLRVQVPNNHILTHNLYYNCYYQNPKYPMIGYMDP